MNIYDYIDSSLLQQPEPYPGYAYALLKETDTVCNLREMLAELYDTPWCDPVYLNFKDPAITEWNCFKLFLYTGNALRHIILFRFGALTLWRSRPVQVVNHCFNISMQDVQAISHIIFTELRQVTYINFQYLFAERRKHSPRMVFYHRQADMIIELPATMDDYMAELGHKTRKRVRDSAKRIAKDYPDYEVRFVASRDIRREHIARIIKMNRDRMESKSKIPLNEDAECENLYRYACNRGLLCLCCVNGEIIAGTINWMFATHAYIPIIAHDNAFNNYRAGYVALSATIRYMIEHGVKTYHMLWGELEYKFHFRARPHYLYDVLVFRHRRGEMLGHIITCLFTLAKTARRRASRVSLLRRLYRRLQGR